jgi:hypothetical protein
MAWLRPPDSSSFSPSYTHSYTLIVNKSRDITVQGEWLSHRGLPAHGVVAPLPRPLVAESGALDLARMGEPHPSHDSNAVVVDIVRAMLSHAG